ncbi:hypothetical protein A3A84_02440 [Candidatus Collierbacteria bacterium RIFCSPLOWO2_01_FULL_50_23]|uniref:Prolipoprotein diacylglyceryl transferase n=2 Tax=Candidatus Collieribacteriota TaxID=1752725 RepID=A0A1F5EX85_9BACT|nr:MAG: hypothetical protein A3D09_00865 [Candidatus Collierbacteria bacterium RIFCSPHIGHO2_02_FULL_49_10]OGD72261.1 MAG: hypothetical protein A2703_02760 [Candidatus Collierbacteria bacterium RIFCSPHIGHO2_01_FULL_50_25]OGD73816.1 MAG: hypothetical protein A3A84_02440 [Candidatus Collierbacteria bacterium RIFCSPLOWO2_01_FULL_50_23]
MSEVLATFSGFSVYTLSLLVVVGYFWYSFVVYKKGLEYRYPVESLLDLAVISGMFSWLGARIGFVASHLSIFELNWLRVFLLREYPGYEYAGLLVGLFLGITLLARRGEIKFYEGLDLASLGLPGAIAFERLGRVFAGLGSLVFGVPLELLQALFFLLIFVWLWRLESEYRTFGWYRFRKTQARPGFICGAFLFFSGLVIATSALPFGLASVFLGLMLIYRQSGRSLAHDVKLLPIFGRWYTKSK